MSEVLLFHHAQGLTTGVFAFADELRQAGHTVHTPDLYQGHTFVELDDGLAYAKKVGFEELVDKGVAAGVPVQIHGMDADPFFAGEGDIDAARELVEATEEAELFVYAGDRHLFADSSWAGYDAAAGNCSPGGCSPSLPPAGLDADDSKVGVRSGALGRI